MKPNPIFCNETPEFWANVKLLSQRLGYYKAKTGFVIPTVQQIKSVFSVEKLNVSKLINERNEFTLYGQKLIDYFTFRKNILHGEVQENLMNADQARELFNEHRVRINPKRAFTLNKQTGEKAGPALFTNLINMMLEENNLEYGCDYDPRELTSITQNGFPTRTLSRRVDGAFPSAINPIAIWEIKEYYYTTTFGSRIADGVYETMLDGYELKEIRENLGVDVKHCLFVDAYDTWWGMGKSYLCRMVDILNMGLVSEIIIGREVVTRLPALVQEWVALAVARGDVKITAGKPTKLFQ